MSFLISLSLCIIGFVILKYFLDKKEKELNIGLNQSVIVDNKEELELVLETSYGSFGTEGDIVFDKPVTYEGLEGEFGLIRIEHQSYEKVDTGKDKEYKWITKRVVEHVGDTFTMYDTKLYSQNFSFPELRIAKEIYESKRERLIVSVVPVKSFISFYAYSGDKGLMNSNGKKKLVDISFLLLEENKEIIKHNTIQKGRYYTMYVFFCCFFIFYITAMISSFLGG